MQLKNYVQRQLALGFKPEIIRNSLKQSGYPDSLIDSALGNGSNIIVRHEIHFPIKTVIILLLLIGLSGGVYWWFTNNSDGALLDVSVKSYNEEYLAGQEVTYGIELINMGKSNRFDATIRYTITDSSGKVLKSYTETLAVETKATSSGKIVLPSSLKPGIYNLNAIVTYGNNKKAESSTEFQIVEQYRPPTREGTSSRGTIVSTSGGSTPSEKSGGTTTSGSKTFGDSMKLIRQQAATSPQAAYNSCIKFTSQTQKDICLGEIAYDTDKVNYCDQIGETVKKDNCYLAFVIRGNTQICDKITDTTTKQYCNQMRIVEQMNYYYQQGDTDKVLELSRQFEPAIYNTNPTPVNYQNTYTQQSTLNMEDFTLTGELD